MRWGSGSKRLSLDSAPAVRGDVPEIKPHQYRLLPRICNSKRWSIRWGPVWTPCLHFLFLSPQKTLLINQGIYPFWEGSLTPSESFSTLQTQLPTLSDPRLEPHSSL